MKNISACGDSEVTVLVGFTRTAAFATCFFVAGCDKVALSSKLRLADIWK